MSAPTTLAARAAMRRVADACGGEAEILAPSVARTVATGTTAGDGAGIAGCEGAPQLAAARPAVRH